MKRIIFLISIILGFFLMTAITLNADQTIKFEWDRNIEFDVIGYQLYRGTTSGGPYEAVGDLIPQVLEGQVLQTIDVFTGPIEQIYFWVVTAKDNCNESGHSNEVTTRVDTITPIPPINLRRKEILLRSEAR